MAGSLAFTAGGIMFAYLLTGAHPVEGKTMNAVLFGRLFSTWHIGPIAIGAPLLAVTLVAEAALLVVAAQAGFLDGPRVLANMAVDSWMPHRFSQLSDRLVTKNGIYLMGTAAAAALLYTRGDIGTLVVMYSINVFITFSLTELGMARHWIVERRSEPRWRSQLAIHGTGLVMCLCILLVISIEKFVQGGWITISTTAVVVFFAFRVRRHYDKVSSGLKRLDEVLAPDTFSDGAVLPSPLDTAAPTAIIGVASFSGLGIHQILSIHRAFPNFFKQLIFISAAVVDSGSFKGIEEIEKLKSATEADLRRYVSWAQHHGFRADYRMAVGTEAVAAIEQMAQELTAEFTRAVVFTGRLIFREERWYHRLLHNETPRAIQRRLQFAGIQTMVLPIRVLD
jgi:hypothetical protein